MQNHTYDAPTLDAPQSLSIDTLPARLGGKTFKYVLGPRGLHQWMKLCVVNSANARVG